MEMQKLYLLVPLAPLIGAAAEDLEGARSLLAPLAESVVHFGPVGAGTAYKLIVNLVGAVMALVMLTVAPGTSSGKTLRLKGKGFTRKDGTRGDQLVTVEILLPDSDEDLVRRLEGWRDTRNLRGRLGV